MFDRYGTDRLAEWKKFRDNLETSTTPYEDVASFWGHAPFVSSYLDPHNPQTWPDPWHLVLDNKLDDLAIALGMLYTIKLTHRFIDTKCEIHTASLPEETHDRFILVVDNQFVLNFDWSSVVGVEKLGECRLSLVYSK